MPSTFVTLPENAGIIRVDTIETVVHNKYDTLDQPNIVVNNRIYRFSTRELAERAMKLLATATSE